MSSGPPGFDADRAWALDSAVVFRPEPFGALAYHFGTRRLSCLKTRKLAAVVERLGSVPTARVAISTTSMHENEARTLELALAQLAESGIIVPRESK